jgi:hypothetical protein
MINADMPTRLWDKFLYRCGTVTFMRQQRIKHLENTLGTNSLVFSSKAHSYFIFSSVTVTKTRVWIGDWIY